eukprot:351219-Chlamydomonas_euryale.AAC.2
MAPNPHTFNPKIPSRYPTKPTLCRMAERGRTVSAGRGCPKAPIISFDLPTTKQPTLCRRAERGRTVGAGRGCPKGPQRGGAADLGAGRVAR